MNEKSSDDVLLKTFNDEHPLNDNFKILSAILVAEKIELCETEFIKDLYYTDNIYIASFLKCKGFELVAIQRTEDKRTGRLFSHFWFIGKTEVKFFVMSYHNNSIKENVNASSFVTALSAIKKILNIGKMID